MSKSGRKGWDKPVSQKAYQKFSGKAIHMLGVFCPAETVYLSLIMALVDNYLATGEEPERRRHDYYVYCIFMSLLPDIKEARQRSDAARRRAAERRIRRDEAPRAVEPPTVEQDGSEAHCDGGRSRGCR